LDKCVENLEDYTHLKNQLLRIDKDFLSSPNFTSEQIRGELILWWVELSLKVDQEDEAKLAALGLDNSSNRYQLIIHAFTRYYQRKERWLEAFFTLRNCLINAAKIDRVEYDWIISLCGRTGKDSDAEEWNERYFLEYPNLELYKKASFFFETGEKPQKFKAWIKKLLEKRYYSLALDILLLEHYLDDAWNVFESYMVCFFIDEPAVQRLFLEIKSNDPARLIPHFQSFALQGIASRKRNNKTGNILNQITSKITDFNLSTNPPSFLVIFPIILLIVKFSLIFLSETKKSPAAQCHYTHSQAYFV